MTAPPLKGQRRACANKHRHPDEFTARATAQFSITHHKAATVLWVYRCPACKGWHLTHKNGGAKWRVTADDLVKL